MNILAFVIFLSYLNLNIIAQENSNQPNVEQSFIVGKYTVKYIVENRKAVRFPKIDIMTNEHGTIYIDVTIDKYGNVTNAIPNSEMSSTKSNYLVTKSKQAAETTRFDTTPSAPLKTKGTMIFTF